MTPDAVPLRHLLRSMLRLVQDDPDDDDDDDDSNNGNGSQGDENGNGGGGANDPTGINQSTADDFPVGEVPVGTSVISLSDLMRGQDDTDDTDNGSKSDQNEWSYSNTDNQSWRPKNPGTDQGFYDQYVMPALPNLGAQLWQGGLVRSSYEASVSELGSMDSLSRTITKSVYRGVTPPIARAYLDIARPVVPRATGITDEVWLNSYLAEGGGSGSANSSNLDWNFAGVAGKYFGAGALLYAGASAVSRVIQSDTPGKTTVIELGRFSGSFVGGYVGGYLVSDVAGIAFGAAAAAGTLPFAPLIAVGVGGAALFGSVVLSVYGANATGKIAEDLYNALHSNP